MKGLYLGHTVVSLSVLPYASANYIFPVTTEERELRRKYKLQSALMILEVISSLTTELRDMPGTFFTQ